MTRYNNRCWGTATVIVLLATTLVAQADSHGTGKGTSEEPHSLESLIIPVPEPTITDRRKVLLGEKLFHDQRLSANNTVSCATCHAIGSAGEDGKRFAVGIHGTVGDINTPTVFNASFNLAQFWDGRAMSLIDQAKGPILNPKEMGSDWQPVADKLAGDAPLRAEIEAIYPEGITLSTIADAIATYEQTLITTNAPFDRYLRGDRDAITANARKGYQTFVSYGCVSCHNGANVGGNMFQRLGVFGDYFAKNDGISKSDLGRFNVTNKERDKYFFKVPSLRLITKTAPYFHDGSIETLEEAINVMAKYQLGRIITAKEIDLIIEFLTSLEGNYQRVE